jgi:hypothetical protein
LTGHPERIRRLLRWAARDQDAATVWAERLPNPAQRAEALQAVCFKVAERDPGAAVEMAEIYGLEVAPGVVENLVAQWSARDLDAALAWAAARPAGDERDVLITRVAFTLSATDPAGAARLVEDGMSAGSIQAEAAASIVHRWSLQDAAAATEWTEGLPAGLLRERARQELASLDHPSR